MTGKATLNRESDWGRIAGWPFASYVLMAVILTRSGRICGCSPVTAKVRSISYLPDDATGGELFHLHPGKSQSHVVHRRDGQSSEACVRTQVEENEGFTARYNCDRLVWFEAHQDIVKAIACEKELGVGEEPRKLR